MKHIQYFKTGTIALLYICSFAALLLPSCCSDYINGEFYISENAKVYMPDTTILSFQMIDQNGITDNFSKVSERHMYINTSSYSNRCGEGLKIQIFRIRYNSTVNSITLLMSLEGGADGTEMNVDWDNGVSLKYNFDKNMVTSRIKPSFEVLPSIKVNDIIYENVFLFDFSLISGLTNRVNPVKLYIAPRLGLVKYELNNGIVVERNQN